MCNTVINISSNSKDELGRNLHPTYEFTTPIDTIYGPVYSVERFILYITKVNVPKSILSDKTVSTLLKHKKPNNNVPNYWALIAYIISEVLKQQHRLRYEIEKLDNNTRFESFEMKPIIIGGEEELVRQDNTYLHTYTKIIKDFSVLIKNKTFTDECINKIIKTYKTDVNLDITAGTKI